MRLTEKQLAILQALQDDGGQDAHQIGQVLRKQFRDAQGQYKQAQMALTRLEKRRYVRRDTSRPAKWWLTAAGVGKLAVPE